MTRLPLVNPQTATGTNKQIFDGLQKALGTVPNMMRTMANSPAVLNAYAQFSGALNHASLPGKTRELIALVVAETNGCDYCLSAHHALGRMAGLTAEQMTAAREGQSEDRKTLAALRLAQAVVGARGGVNAAEIEAAKLGGLTDGEVAEVIAVVALNIFTNYINRALDVEVDFPRVAPNVPALALAR